MDSKQLFFLLIFIAVLLEAFGDVLIKKWAVGDKNLFLIVGVAIYFIGSIFWIVSLKYEFLSKAISVFTLLNLIVVVLAGVVLFKEELTFLNKLGIALGMVSVALIEFY